MNLILWVSLLTFLFRNLWSSQSLLGISETFLSSVLALQLKCFSVMLCNIYFNSNYIPMEDILQHCMHLHTVFFLIHILWVSCCIYDRTPFYFCFIEYYFFIIYNICTSYYFCSCVVLGCN
jgi:hypothetical protein